MPGNRISRANYSAVRGNSASNIQITGNTAASGGSGITLNMSPAWVHDNRIAGNRSASTFSHAALWILSDSGTVEQNVIVDNSTGVSLFDPSNITGPRLVNNTIARNSDAALIANGASTGAQVTNNILATTAGNAAPARPTRCLKDRRATRTATSSPTRSSPT